LRQAVERLDVILSLNLDIWENAFVPRLSGGLADRLSEVVVELEPLTEAEMVDLLESRAPGLGGQMLARIDHLKAGKHARGLIREAGLVWQEADAQPAAPEPQSAVAAVFAQPAAPPMPASESTGSAGFAEEPDLPEVSAPAATPETPAAAPDSAPDAHRVDDLLRQFRERYGRGSS
jgi:hypothetical protein